MCDLTDKVTVITEFKLYHDPILRCASNSASSSGFSWRWSKDMVMVIMVSSADGQIEGEVQCQSPPNNA